MLLVGGIVACFFGYRLFRIVLAIFGFIFGALGASSFFGVSDTGPMLVAAVAGGLLGAGILIAAYFVGVALIGAGLGAMVANLLFAAGDRDPRFLAVVFMSIAGAAASMYLQRYFIIVGTGFGGAWTMIVGAMALIGDQTTLAAAARGDVWVALSHESRARSAVGADGVAGAWRDWHRRAARHHRRREGQGCPAQEGAVEFQRSTDCSGRGSFPTAPCIPQ